MKIILMSLAFVSVMTSSNTMAAIGCGANICDPANSCYEGCPGNIPRPGDSTKYNLSGQCIVENGDSKVTASFSLKNDQKAILRVNDQLKIDVINNIQNPLLDYEPAAAIQVTTIESNEVTNPPELCPGRPASEREACERRNEENRPYLGPTPVYTKFIVVPNKGSYYILRESSIWPQDLESSMSLILGKTKVHDSFVSCQAIFSKTQI